MWFKGRIEILKLFRLLLFYQIASLSMTHPAFSSDFQTGQSKECTEFWQSKWVLLKSNDGASAAELAALIAVEDWIIPGMNSTFTSKFSFYHSLMNIGLNSELPDHLLEIYKSAAEVYWDSKAIDLAKKSNCFGRQYGSANCISLSRNSPFFIEKEILLPLISQSINNGTKVKCSVELDMRLEKVN